MYDNAKDRNNALNKIQYVLPYCSNTEFVLVALPRVTTPIQANPNPGAPSIAVTAATSCPSTTPYIGHWTVGMTFDAVQWYPIEWNKHIILGCGTSIHFNDILTILL